MNRRRSAGALVDRTDVGGPVIWAPVSVNVVVVMSSSTTALALRTRTRTMRTPASVAEGVHRNVFCRPNAWATCHPVFESHSENSNDNGAVPAVVAAVHVMDLLPATIGNELTSEPSETFAGWIVGSM